MAELTNLNRFRKRKKRAEDRRRGDENAARFGRTRVEREAEAEEAARQERHLDAHRREAGDD